MNESSGDIMQDQEKIEDVMETLSGGAAYYRWNGEKMQTLSYSKGIPLLSGHSEEEYGLLVKENALAIIYEADRKRIQDILLDSVERKKEIVCSFRALHKNGSLIWLNATARVEETDGGIFYVKAFFMKISNEFCMHHDVANLATNGCYVVSDKDYSILYVNQRLEHFLHKKGVEGIIGKKCYSVIQNREYPCENCAIRLKKPSEMLGDRSKQTYIVTPHEMIWDDNKSTIVYLNDITDQRREEQRTLEAKKNLSIAMEHAKMLYWEYEFETSRAYVNEITQRSFGIPAVMEDYPECFLKMNFISDEYRQTYRENVYRMKSGEEYIEFTVKVKTLQQDQVWMKLRLTGVKDGEGNPVRAICTAEVITEYKELEQRFQAIMKQNSISTWLYDIPRHTILLNNDSRNFPLYKDQYEVANVPEAHSIDGFCHPEDMDRLRKLYHDIENGSKQATATVRFWNALENRYRWQRCSYTVISDRDGKPVYAVGSSSDVTEQVETKERYRKAVELREHTKADNILLSCHCNISENRIMELEDQTGVLLKKTIKMSYGSRSR